MKFKSIPIGFLAVLDERVVDELVHDAYQTRCRLSETGMCKVCRREHDHYSADLVPMDRPFPSVQSQAITSPVQKAAQSQRSGSLLRRITNEEALTRSVLVSTTDMHLARDIGAAVRRAYQIERDNPQQKELRVVWRH